MRRAALTLLHILHLSTHRIFCFISRRMSSPAPPATATATAITPPDSSKGTPLIPPPTEEKSCRTPIVQILDEVRRRRLQQGKSSLFPWHRFPLQEDEYTDLLAEVGKELDSVQEFWTHRLRYVSAAPSCRRLLSRRLSLLTSLQQRYDYLPSISTLILRMPTATHERFIRNVVHEMTRQLEALASADRPASDFARQINACGSTTIRFPDDYGRHDPDGSFAHEQAQFPGSSSRSRTRKSGGTLAGWRTITYWGRMGTSGRLWAWTLNTRAMAGAGERAFRARWLLCLCGGQRSPWTMTEKS